MGVAIKIRRTSVIGRNACWMVNECLTKLQGKASLSLLAQALPLTPAGFSHFQIRKSTSKFMTAENENKSGKFKQHCSQKLRKNAFHEQIFVATPLTKTSF